MGCTSSVSLPKRKIVLLGKAGDGKSSAGNTILGENVFAAKASAANERAECKKREKIVYGRKTTVIDTPGAFDTNRDDEETKSEIIKTLIDCAPGIDAFVMVIRVGRYTEHDNEVVQKLLDTLKGGNVLKHTVILFTFGEQLEDKTINEFMKDCSQLQELVDKCGGRCHVIDNKYWNKHKRVNNSNRAQVKNLMKTIDGLVKENGHFTSERLQDVEKRIREEMKNIKKKDGLQREEAKKIVHCNYLREFEGSATRAVLAALFGVSVSDLILSFLISFLAPETGLTAAVAGAAEGLLGAVDFVEGVAGGIAGWIGSEEAEAVCDTIANAAVDTWENGKSLIEKTQELFGLNSKMAFFS